MICETLEHAEKRGANILGEVVGYGSSAVGELAGPNFLEIAFKNVLRAAIGDSDHASPGSLADQGLSTPQCDQAESAAITAVFGDKSQQPPVTTAKGHFGNLGAGSGMVEIIASLKSLGGNLFPIRNLNQIDANCPINAVTDNDTPAGNEFISANVSPQGQASAVRIKTLA